MLYSIVFPNWVESSRINPIDKIPVGSTVNPGQWLSRISSFHEPILFSKRVNFHA